MKNEIGYELSENQKEFVAAALREGYEIDYSYSGRGMYGHQCPAVRLGSGEDFNPSAEHKVDSMGRGSVVYAQY